MEILAASELGLWGEYVLPILLLVLGLSMVIFVHELGHFLVAKLVGIKVERFALGFGKRVFGVQRGETDYCINLIPLGGYIKMLGQEDVAPLTEQADPRAFNNKSVGARFAVISAGVIMNLLFAAVLYVVIGLVGIRFEAPVVGGVVPGSPAASAKVVFSPLPSSGQATTMPASAPLPAAPPGLQPGDVIVSVDGDPISRLLQVKMTAILGEVDRPYRFVVQRDVDGVTRTGTADLQLRLTRSPITSGSELLAFGVEPAMDVAFGIIRENIYSTPFKADDRIVAVNGEPVRAMWETQRIARTLGGRASIVTVDRGGQKVDVPVQPELGMKDWFCLKDGRTIRGRIFSDDLNGDGKVKVRLADGKVDSFDMKDQDMVLLDILGLRPRVRASVVLDGSPAQKAGLLPGDVIDGYADFGPPDWAALVSLTRTQVDKKTSITVERDGKAQAPMWVVPRAKRDTPLIGILRGEDMARLIVATVRKGSPADKAGLRARDVVTRVDQTPVVTWADLYQALKTRAGKPVAIAYLRGSQEQTWTIPVLTDDLFAASDYETELFVGHRPFRELKGPLVKHGPLGAIAWGLNETWGFTLQQYAQLRSMFRGSVSTKEVSGPLGIGKIAIDIGRRGVMDFVYFMAMISVALAVVNFLPIPVVDGGHAVFLIIEKIRGKPLSNRVMNIIQAGGLVMLLFVFLYATWQDVLRLFL